MKIGKYKKYKFINIIIIMLKKIARWVPRSPDWGLEKGAFLGRL